jgi:hypothetical protein
MGANLGDMAKRVDGFDLEMQDLADYFALGNVLVLAFLLRKIC